MQDRLSDADQRSPADKQQTLLSQLRHRILDGSYSPEEVIPEQALAEAFEVSRTPIREALKQLENEGLVEIRPRVGTFVRYPTRREIIELFQVKESLEGLAAQLLARRTPTVDLHKLKQNLHESSQAIALDNAETYARLVHDFHWTLMLGSQNQKLIEHYDRLMNQMTYHRLVLETIAVPGRLRQSRTEHAAVVAAREYRDSMGAEITMRKHAHTSTRA